MSSLLDDEFARFQSAFTQRGMTLSVEHDDTGISGDATLLQVMLGNFLNNCLRHCPDGAHIRVSWRERVLSVTDNGPGIPPALLHSMTQRFASLDQKGEGLGLGLSIALKIAHLHGAQLSLHDAGPGLRIDVAFQA